MAGSGAPAGPGAAVTDEDLALFGDSFALQPASTEAPGMMAASAAVSFPSAAPVSVPPAHDAMGGMQHRAGMGMGGPGGDMQQLPMSTEPSMARGMVNRRLGFTQKARISERDAAQARLAIARMNLANMPKGTEHHPESEATADISKACTEPSNPWGPYMRSDGIWVTRSGIVLEPGAILPAATRRSNFDVPLEEYASHPWRDPAADRESFFNFELGEMEWVRYAAAQRRIRMELQEALEAARAFGSGRFGPHPPRLGRPPPERILAMAQAGSESSPASSALMALCTMFDVPGTQQAVAAVMQTKMMAQRMQMMQEQQAAAQAAGGMEQPGAIAPGVDMAMSATMGPDGVSADGGHVIVAKPDVIVQLPTSTTGQDGMRDDGGHSRRDDQDSGRRDDGGHSRRDDQYSGRRDDDSRSRRDWEDRRGGGGYGADRGGRDYGGGGYTRGGRGRGGWSRSYGDREDRFTSRPERSGNSRDDDRSAGGATDRRDDEPRRGWSDRSSGGYGGGRRGGGDDRYGDDRGRDFGGRRGGRGRGGYRGGYRGGRDRW